MAAPAHEGLYDVSSSPPTLHGSRCHACGTTFFPPMRWGCEVCGAPEDALAPTELAARGRIHSVATVHLHRGSGIEAPFTVAEIVLDDGPLIRATLHDGDDLAIGDAVAAVWVGDERVEPRFSREVT